jgi:FKBP-type peptidyl-prolyl cis-trans isomerase FklB
MKFNLIFTLALGLLISSVSAQTGPDPANSGQTISYALGMQIAAQLKHDGVDIDMRGLAAGVADMQAGKPALTAEAQKYAMKEMQRDIKNRAEQKHKLEAAANLKAGAAFLAANATKEGVKILDVHAPDGSQAQVQYLVLKSGAGPTPKKTDILKLDYEGRLIDGTVFDSSVQRGTPFTGHADDFIAGWTEPLQKMKTGDKWRLFIPPSLGYGEYVPYNIGPNSTLIYDIELLSIQKAAGADSEAGTNTLSAPAK